VFMLTLIPMGSDREKGEPRDGEGGEGGDDFHDADTEHSESEMQRADAAVSANLLPIEKNGDRLHIAPDQVVSVHANAHYTYVFNGRDDLFCSLSITEVSRRLPKPPFYRTHRSHIVNLAHAGRMKKSGDAAVVELESQVRRTVPISRARVAELRQQLAAFKARGPSETA
jgi:DNA-binding LytR/AlgR family response regulator